MLCEIENANWDFKKLNKINDADDYEKRVETRYHDDEKKKKTKN